MLGNKISLRQSLNIAIDAIDKVLTEVEKAQDEAWSDFPSFNLTRLRLLSQCIDASPQTPAMSLEAQLLLKELSHAINRYIDNWAHEGKDLRDDLNRSWDILDLDGEFVDQLSSTKEQLGSYLYTLQRLPLRMH